MLPKILLPTITTVVINIAQNTPPHNISTVDINVAQNLAQKDSFLQHQQMRKIPVHNVYFVQFLFLSTERGGTYHKI